MGFRDQDDSAKFELVKINRATGTRTVLHDREPIEGRWAADEALKRTLENNRDPIITYELQPIEKAKKKFRAAAFGDATGAMPALNVPEEKTKE